MAFNIGVNVMEVEGRAAPTIVSAPISVAGFLVRSERGIPDLPTFVRGFADFNAYFGGFTPNTFGAHAVKGFFDNGGSEAYVSRVVNTATAVVARQELADRGAVNTLRVFAGSRGRHDPGQWGNELEITITDHARGNAEIPAQIIGSTAEPFALTSGQTLVVSVNGGATPVTVTFATGDFSNIAAASAAEVAAAIQRQTTEFRAGATVGQNVVLASSRPGPTSRLVVTGTAAAALGFTGATANSDQGVTAGSTLLMVQSTGGFLPSSAVRLETRGHVRAPSAMATSMTSGVGINVNPDGVGAQTILFQASDFVGGMGAVTSGEVVAAINRQAIGFMAGLTHNNQLVLMSNSFGPSSSIAIAAPVGPPDATTALGLTAAVPVAGVRVNRRLEGVAENYRFVSWLTGLAAAVPPNAARLQSSEFDLVVSRVGQEVERFESVSMEDTLEYYVGAVVNDPNNGSRYISVQDLNSASGPAADVPAIVSRSLMTTAGQDGTAPFDSHFVGSEPARTGLYAFDSVNIQLLACLETTAQGVITAALDYCERRGDAMFVGNPPFGYSLDAMKTFASPFRARKVYGALYGPWVQVTNPLDKTGTNPLLWIPPAGHVLGTFARIGEARGVWKAPAGDEARLRNILGVEFDMTDVDHTDLVKNGGINGIRAIPGAGIIVDASRTLSTDTRWLFVNVRRLFNFVKSSLREGLRFVAQEPHSEALCRSVKFNVVTPFLLGLWRQGAFGTDPADAVFTVVCDETNNPPAEVNLGNFKIEVYFYPVKPAETIIIAVGQQESGASASEA